MSIKILDAGKLPATIELVYVGVCRHCNCMIKCDAEDGQETRQHALNNPTIIQLTVYWAIKVLCPTKGCQRHITCVPEKKKD
jgi:hypothetical protein